ncbi:MAG: glycoside hydrolase family 88 protein [Cytophagales bacterium]|nr:glycoside hydrolase family 88 protein [Cytophagales bacterium]
MKKILCTGLVFLLVTVAFSQPNPKDILGYMQRVADWQIHHFRDTYSGREEPHHIRDWTNGALYVGMVKWAALSGNNKYYQWLYDIGEEGEWDLHWRKYMADDHAVGQMYLELYRKFQEPKMIKKTRERYDWIMENPSQQPIEMGNYKHLQRWTWCDALFMGPPVWAKLASITNENKYSQWMLEEYKATVDHLFDEKEGLFYRDNTFIDKREHDRKIFWSRGNGWVFAGLALLMDEYEPGSEEYEYFKGIYMKMAKTLKRIQTPAGHWSMSLLAEDVYPTPETSGTSFFTFGLAWGINKGLLKKKKYEPVVKKGWNALCSHVTSGGMVGYVQPIGAAPGKAWPDKTEVYGTGAFLAAGSEVYKLYQN